LLCKPDYFSDSTIHIAGHCRELGHSVFFPALPLPAYIKGFLPVVDIQVNGIMGYLHEKRLAALCLFFDEIARALCDAEDFLGVVNRLGAACSFRSAGKVACVAVTEVIAHFFRRHVVEPEIPLSEMGRHILRICLFEHSRNGQLPQVNNHV